MVQMQMSLAFGSSSDLPTKDFRVYCDLELRYFLRAIVLNGLYSFMVGCSFCIMWLNAASATPAWLFDLICNFSIDGASVSATGLVERGPS
jgi:hypothetical protein